MHVGRVVGSLVSTQKHASLVGMKLMMVQLVDAHKNPLTRYEVAVDTVGAGVGEYVLLTHGSSARSMFNTAEGTAVDNVIVGIVDSFDV